MAAAQENQENPRYNRVEDLLSGLVEQETLSEIKSEMEKTPTTPKPEKTEKKAPAAKNEKVDPPTNTEDEEEQEEEEQEEENEEEDDQPEGKAAKSAKNGEEDKEEKELPELNNKFGIKIHKKEEKKGAKIDIKSFDELPSVLKSKYGQDIKDVKALPKFLETVDKWRSDSQSLDKATKEKDNAINIIQNLPPELFDAVKMHYDGQDFRKAFEGNVKLDFSKAVDKQKPQSLVNAFYPGEFTDEDFEADEPSDKLKIAIKASQKEYNSEKTAREQRAKNHIETADRKDKAYKQSVQSSVNALKSAFPDMLPDVQSDVEHTLSSGALINEFFNSDGTYKPEAAEMLMLAKHGKEVISQLMEIAQLRGESKANEEIVMRSPSTPKGKKGVKPEEIRKEVTETVEKLLPKSLMAKKTF